MNSSTDKIAVFCMKETIMAMNFEPHECIILACLVQPKKIGTQENKAIDSMSKILVVLTQSLYNCSTVTKSQILKVIVHNVVKANVYI